MAANDGRMIRSSNTRAYLNDIKSDTVIMLAATLGAHSHSSRILPRQQTLTPTAMHTPRARPAIELRVAVPLTSLNRPWLIISQIDFPRESHGGLLSGVG
jgi:hypothetical protein